MSDDAKANIVQSVLDRKFSRANSQFADMMRDKAYQSIEDFKNAFKYVAVQKLQKKEADLEKEKKELD
jgi:hypothetical protein